MYAGLSIYGGIWLLVSMFEIIAQGTRPLPRQVSLIIFFAIFNAIILGQWFGFSVTETSAFTQDVFLKDQTIEKAKLVIVMSRDAVLLKDGVLVIVPTADITKFVGKQSLEVK
jgi:hypothetical protein